jgi:hypothetical protein
VEPYVLLEVAPHAVVGTGVGIARASGYAGLFGSSGVDRRTVATASAMGGWISESRWFAAWVRLDGTSWPTAAVTVEVTLAPGGGCRERVPEGEPVLGRRHVSDRVVP